MNISQKYLSIMIAWMGIFAGLFVGCGIIKDEIYLQNVEVAGSLSQLPIHVTDADMQKKTFHVSPHISVSTQKSFITSLERQYSEPIPDSLVDFQHKGLQWNLPSVRFGVDLDYAVSDNATLMGGISTSVGNERQFMSGYGGIGLFTPDTGLSARLDLGLQYNEMSYRSATILERTTTTFGGSSSKQVVYFLDRGKESHINFFASLTINSSNVNQFINYFVQFGVAPQTVTSFTPKEVITQYPYGVTHIVSDQRAESSVVWLSAVPGVYFSVGQSRRVVLGVRFLKDVLSESSEPGVLWIPMVQFDWGL